MSALPGVNRPVFTKEYTKNQIAYYMTKHPDANPEEVAACIRDINKTRFKRPKCEIIQHDNFNSTLVTKDLFGHLMENTRKVMTPSGTFFETHDTKEAPDIKFMENRLDLRDRHKKSMLVHRELGRLDMALLEEYRQQMVKVGTNSVIGGSGSEFSILFDLENFNGTTSVARHDIMTAYVITEKFLANNMYLPSLEHALNFIVAQLRACPSKDEILALVAKYGLYIPTGDEIYSDFLASMKLYFTVPGDDNSVHDLCNRLSSHERAFISYHCNFISLLKYNTELYRKWFDALFSFATLPCDPSVEVKPLKDCWDTELMQFICVVCQDIIGSNKLSLVHNEAPEVARHVITIGTKIADFIKDMQPVFDMFLKARCTIPLIDEQKDMTRRVVALSDTDSVIFTTMSVNIWYHDKLTPGLMSKRLGAFSVYMLSEMLATIVKYISYFRGATGKYTKMMRIKNEWTYSVLVRCDVAKHYFAKATIQEGVTLTKPKYDIKGVQFKSSTLTKTTNDFTEQLIIDVLDELEAHGHIAIDQYIGRVLAYEKLVYGTLKAGKLDYISSVSLKNKAEYKDPDRSVYRLYEIWEAQFSTKYDHIHLPTKVPIIPLHEKMIMSEKYLAWVKTINPDFAYYLGKLSTAEKRKLTRLPIAGSLEKIPDELIPLLNMRSIVYTNVKPSQLVLKAFKVNLNTNGKKMLLLSDIYAPEEDIL